ncbi:hypothetical protein NKH77_15640 [Streptomyces sp. M19]
MITTDGTAAKWAVALLGAAAEMGVLLARRALPLRLAWLGLAVAVGAGIAIMLLSPAGLGEVPVLVGIAHVPMYTRRGRCARPPSRWSRAASASRSW